MVLSAQRLAKLILFLAISCLIVLSLLSYRKIRHLVSFTESIEHTHQVRISLEKMLSTLRQAETSHRGFLITGDTVFQTRFSTARNTLDSLRIALRQLLITDNLQQDRLDSLQFMLGEHFTFMNEVTYIFFTREPDKSLLQTGMSRNNDIHSLIARMEAREKRVLDRQIQEKEKLVFITPVFLLVLTLFSILLPVLSYLIIMRELKKRMKSEIELEKKVGELNRSNNDLEQFAYVASHDLQEPLRKIRSLGDRLSLKHVPMLNEDGKMTISKMQDAASRMQTLIDDLLSFSRLIQERGKFEKHDLNNLVKQVLNDLEVTIRSKEARIHCGPLPTVEVVPSLTRQLFQNILSNALKFLKPGVPGMISIASTTVRGTEIPGLPALRSNENFYKIAIEDNGIGFDEKYLDRIFIIFQRLHGKLEYGGTGIGLAVSKKIMMIHGGYIGASSTVGKGSTFYLYFPVLKIR